MTAAPESPESALSLVTESTAQMFGPPREETWAVAVLDDGTEIRMRHLGDRLEVRGWDPKAECNPPSLRAEVLGRRHHIVDILAATPTAARIEADGLLAADVWDEAVEATVQWIESTGRPGLNGPSDPPLNPYDAEYASPLATRIAQLEADLAASDRAFDVERSTNIRVSRELMKAQADLAAARSALGAVEAVRAKYVGRSSWVGYEKPRREAWDEIERDLRAALATPPQPAP